jgi:hypothetical protein
MNMAFTQIIAHIAMGLKPVAIEKAAGKIKSDFPSYNDL